MVIGVSTGRKRSSNHSTPLAFTIRLRESDPAASGSATRNGTLDVNLLGGTVLLEDTAFDLITNFSQMTLPEDLVAAYSPGSDVFTGVWEAIVDAAETDTLFLNQRHSPALRALRTERTESLVDADHNVFGDFGNAMDLYFGGDMEAAIPLGGQVIGRIDEVRPVGDIIADTVRVVGCRGAHRPHGRRTGLLRGCRQRPAAVVRRLEYADETACPCLHIT